MNKKNTNKEQLYWDSFYDKFSFDIPSQFCTLTATEISKEVAIVEFGCGNGRDTIFFARHGYTIIAMDLSSEAIKRNIEKITNMANITFLQGDVTNHNDMEEAISLARKSRNRTLVVYTRFFLHTLNQSQEESFMTSLDQVLISGDKIYFEFRSMEDAMINKIYGQHFRRFIDSRELIATLEKKLNFNIEYSITGQGMSKYMEEDPYITRIIAIKR